MKEELIEIINELREAIDESKLYGVSPETLFSESCSFMRGKLASENRGNNYQKPKISEPGASSKEFRPLATDKQRKLMNKLKIPFNDKITMKEASNLLKNKLGGNY